MGQVIYWKGYDEPRIIRDAKTGQGWVVFGKWVCDDVRISLIHFYTGWFRRKWYNRRSKRLCLMIITNPPYTPWDYKSENENLVEAEKELIFKAEQYIKDLK